MLTISNNEYLQLLQEQPSNGITYLEYSYNNTEFKGQITNIEKFDEIFKKLNKSSTFTTFEKKLFTV